MSVARAASAGGVRCASAAAAPSGSGIAELLDGPEVTPARSVRDAIVARHQEIKWDYKSAVRHVDALASGLLESGYTAGSKCAAARPARWPRARSRARVMPFCCRECAGSRRGCPRTRSTWSRCLRQRALA